MNEFIISNPVGTIFFVLGFALTLILFLTALFVPQLPIGVYTNKPRSSNINAQIFLGIAAVACLVGSVISFSR